MSNVSYITLSRASSLARELDITANNIANAGTTGFRADRPFYSEYVRALADGSSLSQSRIGGRMIEASRGALVETGGELDLALEDDGYFVVSTPRGERLTRAGAFTTGPDGALLTKEGYALLGEGGAPLAIPAGATSIIVAPDGTLSIDGVPSGRIAFARAEPEALSRESAVLFRVAGATPYVAEGRVRQGALEASNVEPVTEISRLIEVQRAFELARALANQDDERIRRVIDAAARGR